MSMLWHEQIREKLTDFLHPQSPRNIRRLQFFWLGCGGMVIVAFAYGITTFLFESTPLSKQEETFKVTPTSIETATKKVNLEEVFRNKIETALKQLSDKVTGLETMFLEGLKQDVPLSEAQSLDSSPPSDQFNQELQTKIAHLEEQVASHTALPAQPMYPQEEGEQGLIRKVSLSLTENIKQKLPQTVETTIPAGAFAKTVLLSGLDASSSMTASSDPRPMLLRLIDPGTLPRRFQSDLKDCHCTASAYGDLSSERVYARLEKLTCIERKTGEIIETQVAGYIAGSDGKAGIRGVVASKDGQFLGRSLVGGIFAGLSNVANPQNRQAQVNPFAQTGKQPSPPNVGDMFTAGMASGASTALDRLSQYYIDRAEQLQPVIQIAAGQVVDIVFTQGTFIGAQDVKEQIEHSRELSQRESTQPSTQIRN
jgi:conjugal transfer pilus assembly protein TraB